MSNIITKLSPYGACDIADALLRLGHPFGGFLSGLKLRGPSRESKMIGRAHTVFFRMNTPEPIKHFKGHYIDSVTPGSVLFISAPDEIPNAVYGGLMTLRAQTLGAVGTIVDGNIRDLQEHRALGYTVFSRGTGITAGHEVCYSSEINTPVRLHSRLQPDVWIHPGDILIGDENGVACIPQALENEVAQIVPTLSQRDERCLQALKDGISAEQAFRLRA